jgi:hypothetical protein
MISCCHRKAQKLMFLMKCRKRSTNCCRWCNGSVCCKIYHIAVCYWSKYKVVQIWPGQFVCKQVTVCPGHIWTTLYLVIIFITFIRQHLSFKEITWLMWCQMHSLFIRVNLFNMDNEFYVVCAIECVISLALYFETETFLFYFVLF